MARSLTPTQFLERAAPAARHRQERDRLAAAREALTRLAHTLRHPTLRHLGH